MYQVPRTAEEWWSNLNKHWDGILTTFGLCEKAVFEMRGMGSRVRPLEIDIPALEAARQEGNHRYLYRNLQTMWERAPDRPSINTWPAWQVICDLCSEYEEIF